MNDASKFIKQLKKTIKERRCYKNNIKIKKPPTIFIAGGF
jgi:hypothetical protein